jgi:hypothetical protein
MHALDYPMLYIKWLNGSFCLAKCICIDFSLSNKGMRELKYALNVDQY